jgi:hypothetical protein
MNKEAFEVLQIIFPRGYDLDARLVEAVQKHLKHSKQQLLERLSEKVESKREDNPESLFAVMGYNDALNEVKALIQEEKERL